MAHDATFLKDYLEDKSRFLELQAHFIDKAVEEASDDSSDWSFPALLRASFQKLGKENADIVFRFSESPIETIFLNSLWLCFIRNGQPLVLTPPFDNVQSRLAEFRQQLGNLSRFTDWYGTRNKDEMNLQLFLDDEVRRGRMQPEERPYIDRLILYYHWLPFRDAYHVTLQASFPDILIDGSSVRVDALAWIPSSPSWYVAIECDGFQYHSSQEVFIRDRRKDRGLKAAGIEVQRFSGAEITRDPAGSAYDLFKYLVDHRPDT